MADRYANWSKDRRFTAAEDKVLYEGWTQTEAAAHYGVSRQQLNVRMKARREREAERVEAARLEEAKRSSGPNPDAPTQEKLGFKDWFDTYFTNWTCPDCGVHHEMPDFHLEIADAIQDPEARRVLVNLPPYHAKSTIVSVFDTVYKLCYDRNWRTAIVSKSKDFAQAFVRQIAEILTNDELYEHSNRNLIEDFGPFKPEQGTWNSEELVVAGRTRAEKDPTVKALGFGSQIYGRRFDEIKFDDVATLENSANPDRVMGMLGWIDKEAMSRVGKSGRVIFVGTRVGAGDIYSTLMKRAGYRVIRYSLIVDDHNEQVLWPEHFPYSQALIHRSEMTPADFQLIYQNVDVPGLGASFTQEMMELAKDNTRVLGHYDPSWRLIAGLDPAGANKDSGYTAFTLLGVDLVTGRRHLVDQLSVKQMKAPQMKDQILDWSTRYPIYEWRVEGNGVQSQLVQYDREILTYLAQRGTRVTPHVTHAHNKWDPQFGVESLAPLFTAELISIPWGNAPTTQQMQPCIEEFIGFPMAVRSDRVMSWWFAELGIRDLLKRQHLPLFDTRWKVPGRIKRNRHVVDFGSRTIEPVRPQDQYPGHLTPERAGYRRMTMGNPMPHDRVREAPPPDTRNPYVEPDSDTEPSNVDPTIWD